MDKKIIVPNETNIKVSANEYVTKYSWWRNVQKLIENDAEIEKIYAELTSNTKIKIYEEGKTYDLFDIVWYFNPKTRKLYLLRNILEHNSTHPEKDKEKGNTFEENGWYCANENLDLSKFGVESRINRLINSMFDEHEQDDDLNSGHPYGKLNDKNVDDKLMKRDLSNRNKDRENFLIPFRTVFFPINNDDKVILNGCYRQYDNGYIEYDIIYRFGYEGIVEYDGIDSNVIKCNNLKLSNGSGLPFKDKNYNQNNRYFYNGDAYQIFNHQNNDEDNFSEIDDTLNVNRNDFVNVYSAKIDFPVRFKNLNYMVFNGGIVCQGKDGSVNAQSGANVVTFCNKNLYSITAILITYPDGNFSVRGFNTTHGGLRANSFRCKIVGMAEVEK